MNARPRQIQFLAPAEVYGNLHGKEQGLNVDEVQEIMSTGPVPLKVYGLAWCGIILIYGADYLRKRISAGWGKEGEVLSARAPSRQHDLPLPGHCG